MCKPMSNLYTRPGRSLVYVALRENYSLKFDHDKDWVELVAFLKVRFEKAYSIYILKMLN